MRARNAVILLPLAILAGCAQQHPQLVMMNPRTGVVVGCQVPDTLAGSGDYLISRACLSACAAHGFRPVPGVQTNGPDDTPPPCLN